MRLFSKNNIVTSVMRDSAMHMTRLAIFTFCIVLPQIGFAQSNAAANARESDIPWSIRMTDSFIAEHPDTIWYEGVPKSLLWDYERGVVLEGISQVYVRTHEERFRTYIKKQIDRFVAADGKIQTYDYSSFNLDNVATGRLLFELLESTGDARYKIAIDTIRKQLANQPRTNEGGFWHKKIYPHQMWLDGLYMAEPFYAQYAATFRESSDFDDIANQFLCMERHARDSATGLLFHGWDESKREQWANPASGCSPSFWGRAMGWYAMGLVDVLDLFPKNHPKRMALVEIFKHLASAVAKYRDSTTGVWYQVVDRPHRSGNYPEASSSFMFIYALAKGVRQGYLDASYERVAREAFRSAITTFVKMNEDGTISLQHTCQSAGLGNQPYRDGSFDYYVHEPQRSNDFKGIGAFIMAANELEHSGVGDTMIPRRIVTLDYFYNCEWKQIDGKRVQFHYVWEDTANSGFSKLASIIHSLGAQVNELHNAPIQGSLVSSSIYIIVDPDTPSETEHPNYIEDPAAAVITEYVKNGGVLILMGNDKGNAEFAHLNALAGNFGIHFNEDSHHRVVGNDFDAGKFSQFPDHPLFAGVKQIYLKEISSLSIKEPAEPILVENKIVFMASARVGKGIVFAVGDPWLYNEYIDSRKLPPTYENAKAGENLFRWLLGQSARPLN